ncbi:MAG: Type I Iterative PKS [Chrysothrix sp. TS-e1954]|nr:MAG: Type I Iterative PKS [Chrysothrix sp. TS-e1954]
MAPSILSSVASRREYDELSIKDGHPSPIAIVGMACRLPGNVSSADEFWKLCSRSRDVWSSIPKERFNQEAYYHPNPDKLGCFNAKGGHFLQEDLALFDAPFFNITSQEATALDPQHRLMLECAYEALESGGIPKNAVIGQNVGVFVGGSFADYELNNLRDTQTAPMYQATDAIKAGDSIRAVVVNSGVNQDGRTNGITLPSGTAQTTLMQSVYRNAGIDPRDTGYVEAHGTGTKVGDVIEADALHSVFCQDRSSKEPLFIGSVKSKIGHLEGASGIVSIIKTALMLERGIILPMSNFEKPKDTIPFSEWNLKIPTSIVPWPKSKRFASVNNFGFGGTNAHVILEKAPLTTKAGRSLTVANGHSKDDEHSIRNGSTVTNGASASSPKQNDRRRLFVFSANDEYALRSRLKDTVIYLEQHPPAFQGALMPNLAYTLGQRRSRLAWKVAIPASSSHQLIGALSSNDFTLSRSTDAPNVAFVFTGQGAQWHAMGRELIGEYPLFESTLVHADQCLKRFGAAFSLIVVGHSSGEIAAAYTAGALTIDQCMNIAYHRGIATSALQQDYPHIKGRMLAIGASQAEMEPVVQDLTQGRVVIACVNSPSSVTASGDEEAISELENHLKARGVFNRRLRVDVAYHSHHMQLIAHGYRRSIGDILPILSSNITFHSSLTGQQIDHSLLTESYWVDNLTHPVLFSQALETIWKQSLQEPSTACDTIMLVEIGPHSALEGPIKQTLKTISKSQQSIFYAPSLRRDSNAVDAMLQLASNLLARGAPVDMGAINFSYPPEKALVHLHDLPTYPWQHNTRYWHSPRIAENHKRRRFPRSDFIGSLTDESSDLEPSWRNIVRADDLPWLRHHEIDSTIIYPMAGYIVMAMEASSQRAIMRNVDYDIFVLREFSVTYPLVIIDSTNVETLITITPYAEGTRKASDLWDEFRVQSWSTDKGWTEHCHGLVSVQKDNTSTNVVSGDQSREPFGADMPSGAHTSPVAGEAMYRHLADAGLKYGTTLRGLANCRASDHDAMADFVIPDTAAGMPECYETETFIHPAALDTCIQIVWPILGAGRRGLKQLYLPTFVKEIVVPAVQSKAGDRLSVHGIRSPNMAASKDATLSFSASSAHDPGRPLVSFERLTMTPVFDRDTGTSANAPKELCFRMSWLPLFDSLDSTYFSKLTSPNSSQLEGERARMAMLEQLSYYFLVKVLQQVSITDYESLQQHHKKFYDLVQEQLDLVHKGHWSLQTVEWSKLTEADRHQFIADARATNAPAEMICRVGESLPRILRQEVEPLSVMLEDNLLYRYYSDHDSYKRSYIQAVSVIDKMTSQNPHCKILEIGAGTGGATLPILETIGGSEGRPPRFERYDYTDVSAGFFENAKDKFKAWGNLLSFRKLDIETDPLSQGFERESYDLIIAYNVLHATKEMKSTLAHVRTLLAANGKLLLIEETRSNLRQFMFAVLPGWWLSSEPERSKGPTSSVDKWDQMLRNQGFSGVDLSMQDYPDSPEQCGSLMVSTATSTEKAIKTGVAIVCNETPQGLCIDTLQSLLEKATGMEVLVGSLNNIPIDGKICIFLDELIRPFLSNMTPNEFSNVQRLTSEASGILWAVWGALEHTRTPDANMVVGFARTIRYERSLKFATLVLDQSPMRSSTNAANTVFEAFESAFISNTSQMPDMEYVEEHGHICIPRILNDPQMNRLVHNQTEESEPELQPMLQKSRPLTLTIGVPGSLDTLHFIDDDTSSIPLQDDCLEIEVKASGLNFKDIMIAMGQLSGGTLGAECSGVVAAVGKNVSDFAIGDRVCAMSARAFGNYTRCAATSAHKIDDMPFDLAATIPVVYCTAYHSLIEIGRLVKGESVLIHTAAGGVGQAAITLAKMVGAEIFATVSSIEKKSILLEEYGLREDHIFFSRDTSFGPSIKRCTKGKGVDVILNSLAGDALRTSWECLAHFGRFIEIGKRDIMNNTRLEMSTFENNATFASVDLTVLAAEKPLLMQRLMSNVFGLQRDGFLKMVLPITRFSFSDIESAFRALQSGKSMGKIVLQSDPHDLVMATPAKLPSTLLRADAAYIISGGTGGIGRSIAQWMVQKGARNIILLSRSSDQSPEVKRLIQHLSSLGATVDARKCDVSNKRDVQELVANVEQTVAPIRGVVHGAMVLKDALFENATYEDYTKVVEPKVNGAWNLHNSLLHETLDFFVALSTAAGIVGSRGQAAYAATSTFLSAFVQYRHGLGLPCTTIDLAAVKGVGYLAEHDDKQAQINELFGEEGVTEVELHSLMAAALTGDMATTCDSHSITGMHMQRGQRDLFWMNDAKFSHLLRRREAEEEVQQEENIVTKKTVTLSTMLKSATSIEEAVQFIYDQLVEKASAVLMVPLEDIRPTRPIVAYGLDSLVAIEIRNWIAREMDANLQVLELLAGGSFQRLAKLILKKSKIKHQLHADEVQEKENAE